MAMMEKVFNVIDSKIERIEEQHKRAAVIIINDRLFKQLQQELFMKDSSQAYGKIRSPHDALQVYKGARVIQSQVVDSVEVY